MNDLLTRLSANIEETEVPELLIECFNRGITGEFGCYNPHWWVCVYDDHVAYSYAEDGPYEESPSDDYETYPTPDELLDDHKDLFCGGGDDWWFKHATRNQLY